MIIYTILDADKLETLRHMQALNPSDAPPPAPAASSRKLFFCLKLCLYGLPLIFVISGLVIPNFVRASTTSCRNACINNLRQIEGAMEQAALVLQIPTGTLMTAAQVSPYIKGNEIPKCPGGGAYTIGRLGEAPTCSNVSKDGGHQLIP